VPKERAPQFDLRDTADHHLSIVPSRSGKTVGVNVTLPRPARFSQVGLAIEEIEQLLQFLVDEPDGTVPGSTTFVVRDPESEVGRLQALWNGQGNRLALTLVPSTPWEGDLPTVNLTLDQVAALRGYLSAFARSQ
jgi:hypothetical protein